MGQPINKSDDQSSIVRMSASPTTQSAAPQPADDVALVTAYRDGQERAAAELIERHLSALMRFLYTAGASRDEVDDLAQETLFRAFRRLDSWRGDASFRSWLLSIAGNLLRDHFRRRKLRPIVPLHDHDLAVVADPEADFAATETEARLRSELARLPRLQREVFLLRIQEGVAYEEIAVVLGTTPGAARVHYHQAVKRLKELLR
jgi:RNA polymerase sigma-70 factor (ECF subfamily)